MKFIDFNKVTENYKFTEPGESENIEYKEASWKLPRSFWETVSSFANTSGGIIILGVKEYKQEQFFEITGVDDSEEIVTSIFNDNNNPSCLNRPIIQNSDVTVMDYKDKKIVEIIIHPEEYNARPITAFGIAYVRTGDGDRKATSDQLKYFAVESQNEIDIHLLPNSFGIDDLNKDSIQEYRRELANSGVVKLSNNYDDKELLYSLGVFRKNRLSNTEEYQLTDGGLLFFGKYISITDRFPRFQLDYQKYNSDTTINWVDRVSSGDMNFPSLNIFDFYRLVLQKLTTSVPDKFIQDENYQRTSYYSDLTSAAKEALVNSLVHAYYDGSVGIKIVDRPSYFEFTNPGTMRVSKESFLRGQYSSIRNTEIASLFRRVGISEAAASGGPRILDSAVKNHLKDPEITIDYGMNTTKIRIWKISDTENIKLDDGQKAILELAKKKDNFSVEEAIKYTKGAFGKYTAIRNKIDELVKNQLLQKKREGRKYIYSLNKESNSYFDQIKHIKHLEDNLLR